MWATLRRLLNRRNDSDQEATRPDSAVGRIPRQPVRIPYPNQRRPQREWPVVGVHRTVNRPPIGRNVPMAPWHVRDRRFRSRLRGLDPTEVHDFLHRVANDMAAVYAELAAARNETQRIKDALRQWQSAQASTTYGLVRR